MEENEEILALQTRHRKEKKELQSQIQALKKLAKNDKSKKKELTAEIARLEIEMDNRHTEELKEIEGKNTNSCDKILVDEESDKNEINKVKVSKAQKRRDKKSQQEKDRAEQIKLQEKENVNGPRNIENQTIKSRLKDKNLQLLIIPSDGDCLYKSVAHQLSLTRGDNTSIAELRNKVASYIRNNKDDFLPFMTNPDTFEMLSDIEFEEYCNNIKDTKVWGGQLEVRALSNSLKCPIKIMQAVGPESIDQGEDFDGPPLVITYHRHMYQLGEHYNSTQPILDEEDNE